MKTRLIIVDISNFIFRAFYAVRTMHAPDGTPTNAIYGTLSMLMKLFSEYRPTHILIAKDTPGGSFRSDIYPKYKANRSEPPEDIQRQFPLIKSLLDLMELPCRQSQKYEADDIIGTAATLWKNRFDDILIASGDKDLMQFVDGTVKVVDTMKDKTYGPDDVFEKMGVRPDQVIDYLAMVGDSSDNIPGMKGIGAKGAAKLLAQYGTLEKCIENKSSMKGKKLTDAFNNHTKDGRLSKKLVKIVTDVDLNISVDEMKFHFYPKDELIKFLESLGFKTLPIKLKEIRHQVDVSSESDHSSVISLDKEKHTVDKPVTIIKDDKDLKSLIRFIESTLSISCYTEFSGQDIYKRNISGVGISLDGKMAFYCPVSKGYLSEKQIIHLLKSCWSNENIEIISDHIQSDISYADITGIRFNAKTFDVSQAFYNINPNSKNSLDFIVGHFFGEQLAEKPKEEELLPSYFAHKATALYQVADLLRKKIKQESLENIYYDIDDRTIPILAKMENNGIAIDVSLFKTLEEKIQKDVLKTEKDIREFNGNEPINLNSPKQVAELLFDRLKLPIIKKTKTGPSTDVEVLIDLASRELSPVPNILLQHRELGKLLSTYVKVLPNLVNDTTRRIHSHFHQNVTATGRLSSTNPNLQNIPTKTDKGKEIRRGFIAEKGNVLLGADYSQVELRLLAHFSQDPIMLRFFENKQDVHTQTASEILGINIGDVTPAERSKAKAVNYGLMYGQSSFGLSKAIRITRKEAKNYIIKYFERFSRIKVFLDTLKESCEEKGYAITYHGRKRFLPDIHSKNRTVKAHAERMAVNTPIQGSVADIIKIAMIRIDERISQEGLDAKILLQVHDELIFEVPEPELKKMERLVVEEMENVVNLSVPLKVDVHTATNWFDLK